MVCRTFARRASAELGTGELPTEGTITSWLDETRDRLSAVAARRALSRRDFAATLVLVVSIGESTVVFHVGDGCAVLRVADTAEWIAPVWPAHGEYASTTSFVTDDVPTHQFARCDKPISAFAVFSDGLERLVLNFATHLPHGRFFDRMIGPLERSGESGRSASLSAGLRTFLDSEQINERTDDDKSLVLAARCP